MDLLRFSTAGSVDDGKSTLIGRLLFDSKSIFEDQLEAVKGASRNRTAGEVDLSLLTDGLRAEREQGITIDVAYRYFATPVRKFIIADTPGHEQYTRNMATGASTADLAIILIDARKGVLPQSRRHTAISAMLGIPHLVVAVNKMDLVGWSQDVFDKIRQDYLEFAKSVGAKEPVFIPLSALEGGNVVDRAAETPWYEGPTLLQHLETVEVGETEVAAPFRFPVQLVIRPDLDFRGFAGRIATGSVKVGDQLEVLASGRTSRVKRIHTLDGDLQEAHFPQSVTILLEDEIDISRGDLLVKHGEAPNQVREFEADIVWMDHQPLRTNRPYFLQIGSRLVRAQVSKIVYRRDIVSLEKMDAEELNLNDIARIRIRAAQPVALDAYDTFRQTGAFLLIDPETNQSSGSGMIASDQPLELRNVVWSASQVDRTAREIRNGHKGGVLWFTGLSGSGKSAVARAVEAKLFGRGAQTYLLDGDNLRHGLNQDLGFAPGDRTENLRRAAELAKILADAGFVVLASFISPLESDRAQIRRIVGDADYKEIFVSTPVEECEKRDPKGLYARARAGEIPQFTGISAPYETPKAADLVLPTHQWTIEKSVAAVLELLDKKSVHPGGEVDGAGEGI